MYNYIKMFNKIRKLSRYNNIKTKSKTKTKLKHKLIGGRIVGKGSYGCVVTPSIPCKQTNKNILQTEANDKTVSKIILAPNGNESSEELEISNKLKQIDPKQQFFITFDDACYINKIPQERSNTVSVRYKYRNSNNNYEILDKIKKKDKDYCKVDLSYKPINLVMSHGGNDLFDIIDSSKESKEINIIRKQLMMYFKQNFKNLLIGILKMHNARIVNRDIKKENIMVKYDEKKNKLLPRFIDFGLSSDLTPEFCSNIKNIILNGTEGLISPEQIMSYYIVKYSRNNNYKVYDSYTNKKILDDINDDIKHIKEFLLSINETKVASTLNDTTKLLYTKIKNEFNTNTILPIYFGTTQNKYDGYLQKGDVFAMGLTIYEFLEYFRNQFRLNEYDRLLNVRKNHVLYDLLLHMIELDPSKRYNIVQCLKHPYFTN